MGQFTVLSSCSGTVLNGLTPAVSWHADSGCFLGNHVSLSHVLQRTVLSLLVKTDLMSLELQSESFQH